MDRVSNSLPLPCRRVSAKRNSRKQRTCAGHLQKRESLPGGTGCGDGTSILTSSSQCFMIQTQVTVTIVIAVPPALSDLNGVPVLVTCRASICVSETDPAPVLNPLLLTLHCS